MHPHRSSALPLDGAAAALKVARTPRCWDRATVMVLVSPSSGPRVSGCIRARRYFGPYPRRARPLSRSLRGLGATSGPATSKHTTSILSICPRTYQFMLSVRVDHLVVTGQRLRSDDHAADKGYRRYPG